MRQEPAVFLGQFTALCAAILVLLRTLGVPITEDNQDAINKVVAIAAPLILGVIIRRAVYAPDTVARLTKGRVAGDATVGEDKSVC